MSIVSILSAFASATPQTTDEQKIIQGLQSAMEGMRKVKSERWYVSNASADGLTANLDIRIQPKYDQTKAVQAFMGLKFGFCDLYDGYPIQKWVWSLLLI